MSPPHGGHCSAQAHAVLSADHGCIAFAFPFSVDAQLQWLPTYAAQRTSTFSHSVPCAYRTHNALVRCTVLLSAAANSVVHAAL